MFRNFIYFIVVLLIYTTYGPTKEIPFAPLKTLVLFLALAAAFAVFTRLQFRSIEHRISTESLARLDSRFNTALTRHSILAVLVFAVDIYGLNMPVFFSGFTFFIKIPTLQALFFLAIFVGYLSLVWFFAHPVYRRLYNLDISGGSYVSSNILFALPVLLPWFFLSLFADLINVLPFRLPKQMLATTEGQVVYFLVFLFAASIFGPSLVQRFWRCRPLEMGPKRYRIERLCEKAGLKYADILYWPIFGGRMITAGVMGLYRKYRYILVTDALLSYLEPEEIDAVIAHEIGHIKKNHLLFYLFFFVGYLLLSYATFDLMAFAILYSRITYRFIETLGLHQASALSIIFSLLIISLFLFYFRYIFGYFMRNFERQADAYVYTLFHSAGHLISTLNKIAMTTGQPADRPNWHHFSIAERIGYLKNCEQDSRWILRHDRKIRNSIALYLIGIFFIGTVGYHLNFGETGRLLNAHFFEKILISELERSPQNARLYSMLGDLYYGRKTYADTAEAYEQALQLDPDLPQVLNNLAWLYATCEDPQFQNPKRALELAEKAASLEHSPHIWDTLAESYFVNGMWDAAVAAGRKALALTKGNHAYYEEQLKKFLDRAAGSG